MSGERSGPFAARLAAVIDAGQDFEWYPTTARMIGEVARRLPGSVRSIMDIGAGDGRVLMSLAKVGGDHRPELFAIEKSHVLLQAQPHEITPVGVDFHEQNLSALPVDVVFSNPPYSEFEQWATRIVETAFAQMAFLVLPRRWKESTAIAVALTKRKATATAVYSDTFEHADRQSRAVVDIVQVRFPMSSDYRREPVDPFDQWFDQNISTFEVEGAPAEDDAGVDLARVRGLTTIAELVDAYNEDYARMENNYRAIFKLDYAILKELGVSKDAVRNGLKKRMAGLKIAYWQLLFEKLEAVTSRLSTKTKKLFLDRLTGQQTVAFTYDNAFAIVMWAIKHANLYFNQQVVDLFHQLATFEHVLNYKSNVKVWAKRDGWRYHSEDYSHFALDYRIVVERYNAIHSGDFGRWEYPGGLANSAHELLDDMIAVFSNLGFPLGVLWPSRNREWASGTLHAFELADGRTLFEVRAYKNGNVHLRILPDAIKALNVEAGRLLGWLHAPDDVERELGYSAAEARTLFGSNRQLTASSVKLLTAGSLLAEPSQETPTGRLF